MSTSKAPSSSSKPANANANASASASASANDPIPKYTTPRPGHTLTGARIPNHMFSLYELLTAALGPHPLPGHELFFSPAATGAANANANANATGGGGGIANHPQMVSLLARMLRRRTDAVYDQKMHDFLSELNFMQNETMPGPGAEEAYLYADGVVDRAKELQRGMEGLLRRVREEKMRPAVREKGVGEVKGRERELVMFPFDFSDTRRNKAEEGGEVEDVEDEDGGEGAEKKQGGKRKRSGKKVKKGKRGAKGKKAVKA